MPASYNLLSSPQPNTKAINLQQGRLMMHPDGDDRIFVHSVFMERFLSCIAIFSVLQWHYLNEEVEQWNFM